VLGSLLTLDLADDVFWNYKHIQQYNNPNQPMQFGSRIGGAGMIRQNA
jgi:hypothetical protein